MPGQEVLYSLSYLPGSLGIRSPPGSPWNIIVGAYLYWGNSVHFSL